MYFLDDGFRSFPGFHSRTVLTFVLKILTLMLVDSCFEFQMFLSCKYAALAFPISAFTSASDPPCSSMILTKYVKIFTFSKSSPSIVTCLVHAVLYRRILLLPLCLFRPTTAQWSFSPAFVVAIEIGRSDRPTAS
ncbi:unnamed protein product [Schistosoma mattheei]|uniref:Uncharacterized protein n=1 Tax=Schistosoma mattheei TaxID=31246 RepID=A0A3P8BL89_9TREM|nr:unnamed protein product [Schistosoma mattheei]